MIQSPVYIEKELRDIQDKTSVLKDFNVVSKEDIRLQPKNNSLQHILILKEFVKKSELLKDHNIEVKPQINGVDVELRLK